MNFDEKRGRGSDLDLKKSATAPAKLVISY